MSKNACELNVLFRGFDAIRKLGILSQKHSIFDSQNGRVSSFLVNKTTVVIKKHNHCLSVKFKVHQTPIFEPFSNKSIDIKKMLSEEKNSF